MALREATRRWSMRGAWATLLVASSLLVGLRVGRPVYYTDGAREIGGHVLANAGMLQWRTPEVVAELPGPVAGRLCELPDGRLLYGRLGEDGTADLVTWHPARPGVPPEPVYGVNTPHNELAPAIGPDGRVFFASDRHGGAGGYDLYVTPRLLAGAAEIAPLAACNTALDETDPAPHGNGVDLVFVRSDREQDDGNNGTLWRWRVGDALDPVMVFAAAARGSRPTQQPVERDPVFAPDGAALWFVQKERGQRLQLVRASLLNGAFDAPVAVGGDWGTGELRSPVPGADGRRLGLLAPKVGDGAGDLWYFAAAHEVYPWWPGQRWLEWILAGIAAISALLLLLLHLGRRWSSLDLVAQCLLLSLLLHFLLFLWLMGVEITGALLRGDDDAGGFEVNVIHAATAATASSASDVGADVRFTPQERVLTAQAPDSEPVRAEAGDQLAAPSGEWEGLVEARPLEATAALADASGDVHKRAGVDASAAVGAAALDSVQAKAAAPANARAGVAASAVEVVVPGSAMARPGASPALLAAAPALPEQAPAPVANGTGAPAPALQDAGEPAAAAETPRAGHDAPVAAPALAVQARELAPAAPAAASAARSTAGTAELRAASSLAKPSSGLVRNSRPLDSHVAPPANTPAPGPRAVAMPSPLRADTPAAAPAAKAPAPGPARPAPPSLTPLAAPSAAPVASSVARPVRAAEAGVVEAVRLTVAPPPSRLLRAPAAAPVLPAAMPMATASAYSNRFGPAKTKALEKFGGTDATERAVASGLRYLARIQNSDGSWGDRSDFDGKYGLVYVGKSALCVLAFLGAGHTPASNTEHSGVVKKAIAHLLALQEEDSGAFGPSSCYGHGIATYALAECYGLTKSTELLRPLEKALTWIVDHQGPRRDRRNRGGWGYFSPGMQPEDDYARVSVSAWMVMALESARLSGIELPEDVMPRAREYIELSFDQPNGWFRYNHKPSRVNSQWPTLPSSTPAGAFCLMLLGAGPGDEKVDAAVRYTVERRPEQYRRYEDDDFVLRGQGNVYFWYYGTLCCFLAGGERWAEWNSRLRTVLPGAQSSDGSFPPIDVYAQQAGDTRRDRAYTTAMCVLCLEVYYRYFTPLLLGR